MRESTPPLTSPAIAKFPFEQPIKCIAMDLPKTTTNLATSDHCLHNWPLSFCSFYMQTCIFPHTY